MEVSLKPVLQFGEMLELLLVLSLQLTTNTNSVVCEGCDIGGHNTATLDGVVPVTSKNGGNFADDDDEQFCEAESCPASSAEWDQQRGVSDAEGTVKIGEFVRVTNGDEWDENGYVTFCPCVGNFGNQVELYLSAIAFAKAVNRTLLLPPFYHIHHKGRPSRKFHKSVPFTDFFRVDAVQEFHRAISLDDFLATLAPKHWPQGQRKAYAYPFKGECSLLQSELFYKELSQPVQFDECVPTKLRSDVDLSDEISRTTMKNLWSESFPPQDHPVLAFSGPIGRFPMLAGNRFLQKYLRWTDAAFATAKAYISETFGEDSWVSVHLRNGQDWEKACEMDLDKMSYLMASPQCHEIKVGALTKDMCLPSVPHIRELTWQIFQDVKAKHLFVATDKHPHLEEFRTLLEPLGVVVHHWNPDSPQLDVMVLAQANYFIGTCTSSFTSIVKRERDANGKPSIFWGQEYKGFE